MRVLIADDQAEVRSALRILLEQTQVDFVFEEASDIAVLHEKAGTFRPDIVLLDWELPGSGMWNEVSTLRRLARGVSIIALSVKPEAEGAARAAGVDAFASKGENPDALLATIRRIRQGTGHTAR